MPCRGWTRRTSPVENPDHTVWGPGKFVSFREGASGGVGFGPRIEGENGVGYVFVITDCTKDEAEAIFLKRNAATPNHLRVVTFDIDKLPSEIRASLEANYTAEVTLAQLQAASTNAATGLVGF